VEHSGRETPEVISNVVSPSKPTQALDSTLHLISNIPHVRSLLSEVVVGDDVQAARYQTDRLLAMLKRAVEREVDVSKGLWESSKKSIIQ
jgi:hypothetical protein